MTGAYIAYDHDYGSWRMELLTELNAAGFDIDANRLIKSKP